MSDWTPKERLKMIDVIAFYIAGTRTNPQQMNNLICMIQHLCVKSDAWLEDNKEKFQPIRDEVDMSHE